MAGGIPLSEWSGSGATRELHETIKLQIEATEKQSGLIGRLTIFMAILAFVQTCATVVQVLPIIQGPQNKQATNNLPNPTTKLNQQQTKPEPVIHATPVQPPSKP